MRHGYFRMPSRAMVQCHQLDGEPSTWCVASVRVPEPFREQGLASELMREVCADADAEHVTLILDIHPNVFDGPDEFQLRRWYEKLGFSGDGYRLTRQPR